MAIIIDPDNLALATDVVIDTSALTIEIKTTGAVTNAGSTGGVGGQCLYSFLKEQWKSSSTLIKYPFPMEAITPEQFEFINGWAPKDDTTRKLIRSAGWSEKSALGVVKRKYMGVVSLGSIGASDQPYYRWNSSAKVNFTYSGAVNEAVQIYGDASNGNFDYSDGGATLTLFVREYGKTYSSATNASIGAATLSYQVYRFPMSNSSDLKVVADDATVASTSPYNQINVEYFNSDQGRNIDGATSYYRVIVTDASGTATPSQIYTKLQYLLRQNSDIDAGAGTVTGATANALAAFVGDTLVTTTSVAIDSLNANYLNSVTFTDKIGVTHNYPFIAAGTVSFGQNAGSGDFKWYMFHASTYGTGSASVVTDNSSNPIQGTYSGSSVSFTFPYDAYSAAGHTPGTDLNVKLVGIGLNGGQFTSVDFTIKRAQGQSVQLAPALERNYSNP